MESCIHGMRCEMEIKYRIYEAQRVMGRLGCLRGEASALIQARVCERVNSHANDGGHTFI